jgi:predicted nucleic acid-binding protein
LRLVLDTRFFAEYFYSQDSQLRHEAYKKMEELSKNADGIIPTMVVCELIQLICSKEGKERAEMVYSSIMDSGLKIESLAPSIAKEAGILKSTHKNVPIGDCIIAATAIRNQARILSDDAHFDAIKETKRIWL